MSHTYLTDLYYLIDQRLEEAAHESKMKKTADFEGDFLKGRSDTLQELKDFLKNNYHHKLPRRLRGK